MIYLIDVAAGMSVVRMLRVYAQVAGVINKNFNLLNCRLREWKTGTRVAVLSKVKIHSSG